MNLPERGPPGSKSKPKIEVRSRHLVGRGSPKEEGGSGQINANARGEACSRQRDKAAFVTHTRMKARKSPPPPALRCPLPSPASLSFASVHRPRTRTRATNQTKPKQASTPRAPSSTLSLLCALRSSAASFFIGLCCVALYRVVSCFHPFSALYFLGPFKGLSRVSGV